MPLFHIESPHFPHIHADLLYSHIGYNVITYFRSVYIEVRKKRPKMPTPTTFGRIFVVRRFACPTNWWASCFLLTECFEILCWASKPGNFFSTSGRRYWPIAQREFYSTNIKDHWYSPLVVSLTRMGKQRTAVCGIFSQVRRAKHYCLNCSIVH